MCRLLGGSGLRQLHYSSSLIPDAGFQSSLSSPACLKIEKASSLRLVQPSTGCRGFLLRGSRGLSKQVNNRDTLGHHMAYKGY